jgi:uncharacterized protein
VAWMIVSEDSAEGPSLRQDKALMAAHWAYELSIRDRILAAGSLRTDDGKTPVGGEDCHRLVPRRHVEDEEPADPATKAGLRGTVSVRYWNPAILAGAVID